MIINLMQEKNLVIPTYLIPIFKKYQLSLEELLLFSYFWNYQGELFDVEKISKTIKLSEEEVLNAFNILIHKKLVNLITKKDEFNKTIEMVDLTLFLEEVDLNFQKEEKKEEETEIYSTFEREFGRTISPMEYEIIHAWLEKGFSEELILGALKEAIYNGVTSLRYIDKILYEWQKKGYKTMKEVMEFNRPPQNEKVSELADWNWLEEHEN